MMNYKQKYLKYKIKYLTTKKLYGGMEDGDGNGVGLGSEPLPTGNISLQTNFPTPEKFRVTRAARLKKSESLPLSIQPTLPSYTRRTRSLPEIEYKTPSPELKQGTLPPKIESEIRYEDLIRKDIDEGRNLTISDEEEKQYKENSQERLKALLNEYKAIEEDSRVDKATKIRTRILIEDIKLKLQKLEEGAAKLRRSP